MKTVIVEISIKEYDSKDGITSTNSKVILSERFIRPDFHSAYCELQGVLGRTLGQHILNSSRAA